MVFGLFGAYFFGKNSFSVSVFTAAVCGVCACSAGAVGSFSNKPLSTKINTEINTNVTLPTDVSFLFLHSGIVNL